MKKKNVFCEVTMLNGKKRIFQFPNDLRSAMLVSYNSGELSKIMEGALINVPTSKYSKKGRVRLHLAKINKVFTAKRNQKWRTRGQFLTEDTWNIKGMNISQLKFLLHDHSLLNKIRITFDLLIWKLK